MGYMIFTFLVLASVAQGSYVPTLTVESSGLSKQEVVLINQLIVNQKDAITVYRDILKKIFDIFSDPNANTEDDASNIYELFVGSSTAIDLDFASIPIAVGKDRSTIEDARTETYKYLEDAATRITAIFNLIRSGKYSDNLDAIGVHEAAVLEDAERCVQIFYDLIRTILNTTNADMLAVIETAQDGSNAPKKHFVSAIINAMRFRAGRADVGYTDEDFAAHMREFESKAVVGVVKDIEYRFALLQTQVINRYRNRSDIIRELFWNEHSMIASTNRYKKGNDIILDLVINYLERIYLKLGDDGDLSLSANDAAYRLSLALFNGGDAANFKSFKIIYPESSSMIDERLKSLEEKNTVIASYFEAIEAAWRSTNADAMNQIETLEDSVDALATDFAEFYVATVRNNQTFDEDTEAEFERLQEMLKNSATITFYGYLDTFRILANAHKADVVREDDISKVQAVRDVADFGFVQFTQGIHACVLLVLNARTST